MICYIPLICAMVKTTTSRTRASSSNPNDVNKFSHSVLLKTEKIIKFAKMLQDFIILQQNEILPYCVNDLQAMPSESQEKIQEQPKRKVGRPPKSQVREFLSEDYEKDKPKVPMSKEGSRLLKSDILPRNSNKPVLIRCGFDDNGLPLYKRVFNPNSPRSESVSGKSKGSIPSDMVRKLDEYILNEYKDDDVSFASTH